MRRLACFLTWKAAPGRRIDGVDYVESVPLAGDAPMPLAADAKRTGTRLAWQEAGFIASGSAGEAPSAAVRADFLNLFAARLDYLRRLQASSAVVGYPKRY